MSIFSLCGNIVGYLSIAYVFIPLIYDWYKYKQSSEIAVLESDSFGLFEFKPTSVNIDPSKPKYHLDIIAIHGLNGNRLETWTDRRTGKLWLRDFLPDALPGARVFSFGYDSTFFSHSRSRVPEFANNLLSQLSTIRKLEPERPRGIIFICHSLGGIVFKQALISAQGHAREGNKYSDIVESTKAVVFFGTPHCGSPYAASLQKLDKLVRAMDPWSIIDRLCGSTRPGLISTLKDRSDELQSISQLFVSRTADLKIISFLEGSVIGGLQELIVPDASARLNVPNEDVIVLPNSNHIDMCRLVSEEAHQYQVVLGLCKEYGAPTMEADPARPLNPQEQECLKALNTVDMDDCRAELNELHPPLAGSCRWILSDEKHRNWIRDDRLILLCITGHLGIGKSILMSYLVDNINSLVENITPPNLEKVSIGYFFCFDTDGRREGQAILRSLLLQILYQRHDLIRHATARCVKRGPRQWRFPDLLDILKDIMLDPVTGTIIFLIDALDECEQAAIVQILGISHYLAQLALPPSNRIKVLIASRPISEITERLRDTTSLILLDDDPEVKNVERDIKLFVQDRLNSWKSKNLWPTDFRKALEENILRRAEGNFRWVSLVIQRMRASRQDRHSLKQIVDDSSDMDGLYRRMLAEIEPENRNFAAKTLRILAGSSRALTTEELPTALAVTLNDRTLTSVDENSDMDIEKTLMHVLGPLIRISNSKVYLVHQDFKKFLYKLSGEEEEKSNVLGSDLGEEFGITPEMANLELATACIAFLNLEDFDGQNIVNEDADEFFEFLGAIEDDSVFLDEPEANSSAVKSAILAKPEDPMGSFYEYAACNWGIHLRASGPSLPQELRDATVSLMQQNTARLCNWADTYRRSSKNWEVLPKKLDPLIIAAFFGLTQFAIDILESGTIEMQENSRAHALTWACRLGFADFAKILLDHGTPVTGALIDNRSPLSWACAGGYIDIVKILIEKADTIQINTCDGGGRSPLSVAVGAGNFAIVKLLMARKDVNVNMVDRDGWSPVFWAIGVKSQEDLKMMKDLISDSRVNIGLRDRSGRTILSWAAIEGDCDTLNILLQSSRRQEVGDLLNDQGDKCDGRTPLSLAAHNGHLEAVRILCQNQLSGPRLIKDKFGKNAFILAADRNYTQIIKVLAQSYPDDIDVKDNSQRTALSSAIWAGTNNAETVRTLLRLGGDRVDVNTKSFSGMTPLMYAAECGRLDLVRILVEEGGADMTLSEGSEAGINKVRLSVEKQISCLKESRSRGVVK